MKNKVEKKHAKIVDLVLIVGSMLILSGMFYQYYYNWGNGQPVSLSPPDGFQTENRFVLFEFENAKTILIDDNIEFSSPEKYNVKNNFVINLKPGVYYWKIEGEREIRQFTIESEVSLKLRDKGEGKYEIVNAGNENLNVDVYQFGKLKENVILDVYQSKEVSGNQFIGGKK